MSKKKYRTDFLFPRTNMLIGAGSIFNLAGNYFEFNTSKTEQEADFKALENDWGVIGMDLCAVMNENPKETLELEKH